MGRAAKRSGGVGNSGVENRGRLRWTAMLGLVCMGFLAACNDGGPPPPKTDRGTAASDAAASALSGVRLEIVSGSENKSLEPMVKAFGARMGADIQMRYMGSVDIALELEKGTAVDFDAAWPANSLWLVLGDRQKALKHDKSIMRSPVVFGVKTSVAERLGWIGKPDVTVDDVLTAAESGALSFAMTSATQSNSGASAYFGFLSAMAGSPDVLAQEHLDSEDVRAQVRRLLKTVDRSSGSSGWLKDLFLSQYDRFDAMVNYEVLIIEANRELISRGEEPLYAVYPVDGMTIADSPLAYVDKGDAAKEQLFQALQEHLLSAEVQAEIGSTGRRTGLLGLGTGNLDPTIFRQEWGIDPERVISPIPVPGETVVRQALDLYQTALRKPSLTVYVLDFSGSMKGQGEQQLKQAMATLLDQDVARKYFLQPSQDDVHMVIPFDGKPRGMWVRKGNDPAELGGLLAEIRRTDAGGGTNIYAAAGAAMQQLQPYEDRMRDFFPAVILMSDGKSKGSMGELRARLESLSFGYDVPIFSIAFGAADETQLKEISEATSARVFDGKKDLVKAFRSAKGYN